MKNIFVDANVLIAVCNREYPNAIYASMLLSLVEKPSFRLFTSPLCMAILFYYAEKKSGYDQAKKKMLAITKNLHFTDHLPTDLTSVFNNKKINDVEDGLQYYSAIRQNCHYIITQDTNDFYFSEIPVLQPEAFLKSLLK